MTIKNISYYLCFFLCLFSGLLVFGQSNGNSEVHEVSMLGVVRVDSILILTEHSNVFSLRDLVEGRQYILYFAHDDANIESSFSWLNTEDISGIYSIASSEIIFDAQSEKQDFEFQIDIEEGSAPLFFSVIDRTSLRKKGNSLPERPKPLYRMDPIVVDSSPRIEDLVIQDFISSPCFDVEDITYFGDESRGSGRFSNAADAIGFESGIVLSTGIVSALAGPNLMSNDFSFGGDDLNGLGYLDLNQLVGGLGTNDAQVLSMSFLAPSDSIFFNYVFGSEEYCEFVDSEFNDVFGFFLSGPGISGPFSNGAINLALVPGSSDFVAIRTVNSFSNSEFYVDNIDSVQMQQVFGGCSEEEVGPEAQAPESIILDAFTVPLTAQAEVEPCERYNISMAIADVVDNAFGSAVFLEANSFLSNTAIAVQITYLDDSDFAVEGCTEEEVCLTFTRDIEQFDDEAELGLFLDGGSTATPGEDFVGLEDVLVFPEGDSIIQICFNILPDTLSEGQEVIIVNVQGLCDCFPVSFELFIEDSEPLLTEISEPDILTCSQTLVELNATASAIAQFSWTDAQGVVLSDSSSVEVDMAGKYYVRATELSTGCDVIDSVVVEIDTTAPTIVLSNIQNGTCENTEVFIDIAGSSTGNEFTYQWVEVSTGNVLTPQDPLLLQPSSGGSYSITITNSNNGCSSTETYEVSVLDEALQGAIQVNQPACFDSIGSVQWQVETMAGPTMASLDTGQSFSMVSSFQNLTSGEYLLIVEDADGCRFEESFVITQVGIPVISGWRELDTINLGESYSIAYNILSGAESIDSVQWITLDTTISCTDCLMPSMSPKITSEYRMIITTINGCTLEYNFILIVDPTPDIYMPNVFSPNGDDINDIITLYANSVEVSHIPRMDIYNRWGHLVFSARNIPHSDPAFGWDGRRKGEIVPSGVYIYAIELELTSGARLQLTGDLTVIR